MSKVNGGTDMKKALCLIFVLLILLCGCSHDLRFTRNENGNLVSSSGVEYAHIATEGIDSLTYLGKLEFCGRVRGEKRTFRHLSETFQTGMFSIKDAENDNILIRYFPNNECFSIYRKTSLPPCDFTVDQGVFCKGRFYPFTKYT